MTPHGGRPAARMHATVDPAPRARCPHAPAGWRCRRGPHDGGPCAAVPAWWNRSHFANTVRSAARWPR